MNCVRLSLLVAGLMAHCCAGAPMLDISALPSGAAPIHLDTALASASSFDQAARYVAFVVFSRTATLNALPGSTLAVSEPMMAETGDDDLLIPDEASTPGARSTLSQPPQPVTPSASKTL